MNVGVLLLVRQETDGTVRHHHRVVVTNTDDLHGYTFVGLEAAD